MFVQKDTPGYYVVCEYYPPGNVEGDNNQYFIDNVPKQAKGKASDTVESGVTASSGAYRSGHLPWVFELVLAVGCVALLA